MNEPIKKGDLCEVIDGAKGKDSPNIGLFVTVVAAQGEHSKYGPMWLCDAGGNAELAQAGTRDVSGGLAHFAQAWLKKRPKPPLPPAAEKRDVSAPVGAAA